MTSLPATDIIYDPFETLNRTFAWAWETVRTAYDVTAELPDLQTLFDNADLSNPNQVAEMVVANMLMEMTERVSRFSAWYRMPARSYGLISVRSPVTNCIHWMLAPEAVHRWQDVLERLAHVIQRNAGVLRAILLVDSLWENIPANDPCVTAYCRCAPPHAIQLKQSILDKTKILCETCQQPYG